MPLCIKAASWQTVHHLVGPLAELLQNGDLGQGKNAHLCHTLMIVDDERQ